MFDDHISKPSTLSGKRWLVLIPIALFAYIVGSFFPISTLINRESSFNTTTPSRQPKIANFDRRILEAAKNIDFREIIKAYNTNPEIFSQKYKGRAFLFSGKIKYILGASDHEDNFSISFESENGFSDNIFLSFSNLASEQKVAFRKGQSLTARCLVADADPSNLFLNQCELDRIMKAASIEVGVSGVNSKWLIGSWAGAEHNPRNIPNAPCDTDVLIVFKHGGYFEDGASKGRYKTDGQKITYYSRESVPDIAADPDEVFVAEELPEVSGAVKFLDSNTFSENGERWRRCKS